MVVQHQNVFLIVLYMWINSISPYHRLPLETRQVLFQNWQHGPRME